MPHRILANLVLTFTKENLRKFCKRIKLQVLAAIGFGTLQTFRMVMTCHSGFNSISVSGAAGGASPSPA